MQLATKRTIVDIDTRRVVIMKTRARKQSDVVRVPHEAFLRSMLKDMMGWPSRDPAPESIRVAAREIAAQLNKETLDKSKAIIAAKEAS